MTQSLAALPSLELIGRIYDAALDSARWSGVLAELAADLRCSAGDLSIVDPNAQSVRVQALHNFADQQLERMIRNQYLNPTLHKVHTADLCEPMCSSRDLDIEEFHRTEYWQRTFSETDYYDYLVVVVERSAQVCSSWGVLGTRQRGVFNDWDLAYARAVSPHIARAVRITKLLDFQRVHAQTLDLALDSIGVPALIINEHRQVVHMNAPGRIELKSARLLRCGARGILECTVPEATTASYIQQFGQCASSMQFQTSSHRLVASDGTLFTAEILRLDADSPPGQGLALILLREHDDSISQYISTAAASLKLTQAETRVLSALIGGATLQEAADSLGVARSTIKSHLDAVYAKAGVKRRAELLRHVIQKGTYRK